MAITIESEFTGLYPAYNDGYIIFSSDLVDSFKADIEIEPASLFPVRFLLYPDSDGKYRFNTKEAMRAIYSQYGFKDLNEFYDVYVKELENITITKDITIRVYNDVTNDIEVLSKSFYKAVKQIGDSIFDNLGQLLSYSEDGVNFNLTYYEGFPFSFDIQSVQLGEEMQLKNLNTGALSEIYTSTAAGSYRFLVDKGGQDNWTSDLILPLTEGLNRLELYIDGNFKTNINLYKKKKCSGVCLKWANTSGGYSYFLFNEFYNINTRASEIGRVISNEFDNIADKLGSSSSMGINVSESFVIRTKYNQEEYNVLKDIITSPFVQMYSSENAYTEGKFIDVSVSGSFPHSVKKRNNELVLNVEKTQVNTLIY